MLTTIHVTTRPEGFDLWIKACYTTGTMLYQYICYMCFFLAQVPGEYLGMTYLPIS